LELCRIPFPRNLAHKTRPRSGQMIAYRSVQKMGATSEKRNLVPTNPFTSVTMEGRDTSRDRVLTDDELRELWTAASRLAYPFGPFIQLLTLTLQRRDEVAGMKWAELDPEMAHWTIPAERAKNGRAHIVHLSEPARQILTKLPRQMDPESNGPSPFVFTSNGRTPISGFSKTKTKLEELMTKAARSLRKNASSLATTDWRLHDLRRTGVTVMARLGIGHHVADRVLNHVQGAIKGVAAVYQRHEFLTERAAALDTWARHVLNVAEKRGNEPSDGKVVPLRR
ncbi:tyrosine-type recombinase/integrase, partial [Acetobacter estunensis]